LELRELNRAQDATNEQAVESQAETETIALTPVGLMELARVERGNHVLWVNQLLKCRLISEEEATAMLR
jgi:hypothetical protein